MKHIRWIAVVGLIAIVELQYVWLVNTYKLTRENVMRQSHELFKDAALQEAFGRMIIWKQLYGKKDSTYTYQFKLEADVVDSDTVQEEEIPETRQYIESAVFIAIQEGVSNTFKMDVSLHNLDSIYAHMLDSVGISAKVSTCMTDSLGNVLRASSPQAKLEGQKYLRTRLVPINKAYTRYLQGVILNPYWVIFQRMTLLLIATVLIMVLVIICIVYQIRVIIRQDKIAKMREDFSYAMIHDMKTPLSSILMGTEILESGRLDGQPEKKERYFRIVKEEGEHLLALTNKVLTLSKLENHALKLQQADCLLRPILEDLAEKYKAKTTKQVAFVWDLQEDVVWADEEFLKEALSNLIDNALKYSGEAVEITFLSERKADGTVCVTVADNGFGIPLKDQRKIFEKYERAAASERSRSGGASGFGLGLNYVLRIMEAHGGRVTLESMEGEVGLPWLFLRRVPWKIKKRNNEMEEIIKLLLVEDDANLCYIIQGGLEDMIGGYQVLTASNGEEGLAVWKAQQPDVIVADIEMPVMDGYEMVRRIREQDEYVPILFTSGRVSPKDVVKGYELGVNNYVKKPFLAEELHAHITALLKLTRGVSAQKEVREVPIGKLFSFDTVRGVWKQKGGEERMLTVREADLLRMLCEHKGQVVRREVILSRLWNTEEDYFASRSLDVFVSRLRKLLAADDTVELKTVKGVGLMLEEKV